MCRHSSDAVALPRRRCHPCVQFIVSTMFGLHKRVGLALGGAFVLVPFAWAAELASLRQSSPTYLIRDRGAASPGGALRWRHGMARYNYQR